MPLIQRLSARQSYLRKSASVRLAGEVRSQVILKEKFDPGVVYDIFMSHRYNDAQLNEIDFFDLKQKLERFDLKVYIDWVDDPEFDRSKVSATTAARLRERMTAARSCLFVTSENASTSQWMPWELGFCDGQGKPIAIVPLVSTPGKATYSGPEYLGLYPYLSEHNNTDGDYALWVETKPWKYCHILSWLEGGKLTTDRTMLNRYRPGAY